MLGSFEVRTDDGVLADVPGARLRGLLIALALEPGHAVPKATLVDWIWGERPPSEAANALQRLVSRLRKALPEGLVEGQTDGYRLRVEPDAVDAVRFERLVGQARNDKDPRRVRLLREALALWRGAAMQGVGLTDSAAFDAAVTRLEGLRLTAMEDRFDAEVSLGHGAELVTELTDLVAAHPVRERLVAALMRALVATGRDTEALFVYQRTREALAGALGVDPSPELSALHVALLRGELGRREQRWQEEGRKTNLRAELTSFVGRDADVAAVRELIAGHRLTTVIGPGGSGKTRLATETARTLLGDLPDGAWLVELASIGASGDVAQSTLAALGLRDALLGRAPNVEPMDRLIAAIRERETLLILDNCEHVIESAAAFAHRVLGECQRLRILATSREPLGITGEALWLVEPLALPEGDASPGEIESSPAVQLLRDRQAPDAFLPAWESLLDNEDPWVRALARLQLGKMRIQLGQGGRDADAYLEMALAEFRAIGERWGISFALTELADRIAVRGEFAGACEYYEQAIAVVTEVGAIEDVIRMRSLQAQLYWLLGDEDSSAAAIAEAQRCAERVTWPDALAELALSKAELARWNGDAEEAYQQLGVATTMLGDEAEQAHIRTVTHDLLGYLADDLGEARAHRVAAYEGRPRWGTHSRSRRHSSGSRTWLCVAASTSRPRGCSRRAPPCADSRIAPTRMWPGSSRSRGVASAKRGSPRRRRRARRRAGLSWPPTRSPRER